MTRTQAIKEAQKRWGKSSGWADCHGGLYKVGSGKGGWAQHVRGASEKGYEAAFKKADIK